MSTGGGGNGRIRAPASPQQVHELEQHRAAAVRRTPSGDWLVWDGMTFVRRSDRSPSSSRGNGFRDDS
jgi:hypothetical protein